MSSKQKAQTGQQVNQATKATTFSSPLSPAPGNVNHCLCAFQSILPTERNNNFEYPIPIYNRIMQNKCAVERVMECHIIRRNAFALS